MQSMPLLGPPAQDPARHRGQGWMPPVPASLSPVRKISEERGRFMVVAPVEQSTVPVGAVAISFSTQTLVGVLTGFGTVSGAPNWQPGFVQFLLLPVAVDEVPPTVTTLLVHDVTAVTALPRSGIAYGSGTDCPPPPV